MTETASRRILDVMTGTWAAQAVYVATTLRLPDHIADGRTTVAELAAATGTHERSLGQLVRYLVGLEILTREDGRLALTPAAGFLREGAPDSLVDLVMMYGDEFHRVWGNLLENVRTGRPAFEVTFGAPMYPYFAENPESARRFDGTMSGGFFFSEVPRVVDLSGDGTVVDVAGGTGGLLASVLAANPQREGVLFDVEHVVGQAKEVLGARTDVADRVSYVSGDYTEAVPAGGDVYLLSRILHSRSDDSCVDILRRCREAMEPGGRVVVLERTIPPDGQTSLGLAFDVHMMVLVGGCERSEQEYAELFDRAGFRLDAVHELPLDMFALVASGSGS